MSHSLTARVGARATETARVGARARGIARVGARELPLAAGFWQLASGNLPENWHIAKQLR